MNNHNLSFDQEARRTDSCLTAGAGKTGCAYAEE